MWILRFQQTFEVFDVVDVFSTDVDIDIGDEIFLVVKDIDPEDDTMRKPGFIFLKLNETATGLLSHVPLEVKGGSPIQVLRVDTLPPETLREDTKTEEVLGKVVSFLVILTEERNLHFIPLSDFKSVVESRRPLNLARYSPKPLGTNVALIDQSPLLPNGSRLISVLLLQNRSFFVFMINHRGQVISARVKNPVDVITNLDAVPTSQVFADVTGDGNQELIIATHGGKIYIYGITMSTDGEAIILEWCETLQYQANAKVVPYPALFEDTSRMNESLMVPLIIRATDRIVRTGNMNSNQMNNEGAIIVAHSLPSGRTEFRLEPIELDLDLTGLETIKPMSTSVVKGAPNYLIYQFNDHLELSHVAEDGTESVVHEDQNILNVQRITMGDVLGNGKYDLIILVRPRIELARQFANVPLAKNRAIYIFSDDNPSVIMETVDNLVKTRKHLMENDVRNLVNEFQQSLSIVEKEAILEKLYSILELTTAELNWCHHVTEMMTNLLSQQDDEHQLELDPEFLSKWNGAIENINDTISQLLTTCDEFYDLLDEWDDALSRESEHLAKITPNPIVQFEHQGKKVPLNPQGPSLVHVIIDAKGCPTRLLGIKTNMQLVASCFFEPDPFLILESQGPVRIPLTIFLTDEGFRKLQRGKLKLEFEFNFDNPLNEALTKSVKLKKEFNLQQAFVIREVKVEPTDIIVQSGFKVCITLEALRRLQGQYFKISHVGDPRDIQSIVVPATSSGPLQATRSETSARHVSSTKLSCNEEQLSTIVSTAGDYIPIELYFIANKPVKDHQLGPFRIEYDDPVENLRVQQDIPVTVTIKPLEPRIEVDFQVLQNNVQRDSYSAQRHLDLKILLRNVGHGLARACEVKFNLNRENFQAESILQQEISELPPRMTIPQVMSVRLLPLKAGQLELGTLMIKYHDEANDPKQPLMVPIPPVRIIAEQPMVELESETPLEQYQALPGETLYLQLLATNVGEGTARITRFIMEIGDEIKELPSIGEIKPRETFKLPLAMISVPRTPKTSVLNVSFRLSYADIFGQNIKHAQLGTMTIPILTEDALKAPPLPSTPSEKVLISEKTLDVRSRSVQDVTSPRKTYIPRSLIIKLQKDGWIHEDDVIGIAGTDLHQFMRMLRNSNLSDITPFVTDSKRGKIVLNLQYFIDLIEAHVSQEMRSMHDPSSRINKKEPLFQLDDLIRRHDDILTRRSLGVILVHYFEQVNNKVLGQI